MQLFIFKDFNENKLILNQYLEKILHNKYVHKSRAYNRDRNHFFNKFHTIKNKLSKKTEVSQYHMRYFLFLSPLRYFPSFFYFPSLVTIQCLYKLLNIFLSFFSICFLFFFCSFEFNWRWKCCVKEFSFCNFFFGNYKW